MKWYNGPSCAGYCESNTRRFDSLRGLQFSSLLDVGSGPCRLHTWLQVNGMDCHYEAVDIRADALSLCSCKTYAEIPADGKYDAVCLFGTCGFTNDQTQEFQKSLLVSLIYKSLPLTVKYLVFSGIRDSVNDPHLVKYSEREFIQTVESVCANYTIDARSDPSEWIAVCYV